MGSDTKAHHILVIEDNLGDFTLVEDFLFEYFPAPQITHTRDFRSSAVVFESGKKFDVILLDLSLPDQTGEALIREIVALSGGAPVIVLTGYTDFAFSVKSLSLGVSDYMLKDELTSLSLYKSIIYSQERRKASLALIESEKKYVELFHLSPLPMWVVDLGSLQFLDVNRATIIHFGYSREELLSMTLKDIEPPGETPATEHWITEDRPHNNEHAQRIVTHQKKNGELREVEIQVAPVLYKGKKANLVIATDITERQTYIKAIENQNEKLKEVSWMQSHVIRAPLARIMGLVPLMRLAADKEEENEILQYILLSADDLDTVIRNITEIVRIDSGKQI